MSRRKHKLVDCAPHWVNYAGRVGAAVYFECPEGHDGCHRIIPFTPSLDGTEWPVNGWTRRGDTFENLSLSPSIKGLPKYKTREEALADGVLPEYYQERMLCAVHVVITNGEIEFCSDSM